MNTYELADQYLSPDFPEKYRDLIVNYMIKEEEATLKILHELFNSGTHRGETMIDFGCGPTIHNIASASKYYTNIIMSDYAPSSREAVQKWLNADLQCLDWSAILEIVAELEGYSDTTKGIKQIEERIRKNVKSVIHCDALQEQPLPSHIKDVDLVLTSGCIECSCPTLDLFKSAVKRLGHYVRPGGSMIMLVGINVNNATFDGKEIKFLKVDLETVEEAFKEAGFKKELLYYDRNKGNDSLDFSGSAIITGIKG